MRACIGTSTSLTWPTDPERTEDPAMGGRPDSPDDFSDLAKVSKVGCQKWYRSPSGLSREKTSRAGASESVRGPRSGASDPRQPQKRKTHRYRSSARRDSSVQQRGEYFASSAGTQFKCLLVTCALFSFVDDDTRGA